MLERPNLRPLILVLKAFLWSWKLNDTASGGIGSYLLAILVICYLQNHKDEENDLGQHLVNFFDFYGNKFDYENMGISILKNGDIF